ncbi:MAG: DUF3784 domain-containing protein [Candidatus Heimdallarchaeota archaeon]|nr:DUF3784 domain-containing protein [Candidatus Heimdallarchaeota archaeon]
MAIYALIVGIILCALGILMIFGQPSFLIARYETFQKFIRKKMVGVDKEGLSKFYSILFVVTGVPLIIGAIIGFINPDIYELFSIWLYIALAGIGIIGIVYCNVGKRFIKYKEDI